MSVEVEEKIENKCISGIYKIINQINGKIYVGSAVDLNKRRNNHFSKLKKGTHSNRHLQSSYNKYSFEFFKFEIIEFVENKNNLLEREQYWMDLLDVNNPKKGYNIRLKAENNLGIKFSDEAKKKMSESRKNLPKGIYHYNYGKKLSNETKEKIRKNSPKFWEGKNLSEETKRKISIAIKELFINGKILPHFGKHLSDVQKKRISKTLTGRYLGEDNANSKFKLEQILQIKFMIKNKEKIKNIIEKFNIGRSTIYQIKNGETWSHVRLEDYLDKYGNLIVLK